MTKYGGCLILIILLSVVSGWTQTRKNLDVFYSLIDSSMVLLPDSIPGAGDFSVYTGSNNLIYNYVVGKLSTRYNASVDTFAGNSGLSYVIEDLILKYGEIFRKKFLGEYYLQRNFRVQGNYVLAGKGKIQPFILTQTDTVKLEEAGMLENQELPFTRDKIPTEPFLEGIPEPVVAIATAAAAVILFFVLRSK